jgi:hypothetical protein
MYNIVYVKGDLNIYLSLKEVQYLSKTELYRVEEITQTNKKTPPAKPLSLAVHNRGSKNRTGGH